MATQKERYEFIKILSLHLPNEIVAKADQEYGVDDVIDYVARIIMRHSATLRRIATDECNRPLTEYDRTQEAGATQRISELARSIGCGVVFGGDVSGCLVKLILPDGYTNDFAHEGFCVPTASN